MNPSRATSPVVADPARQRSLILVLGTIIFFSVLNGTMFNVVVPEIARDFSLSSSRVSWVMTAYIAVFALGSVSYGKLADIWPIRRLVLIGLLLLNGGSLIGLLARDYPSLVLARIVQASGGAAIPALSMLVAIRFFPAEQKGRVFGAISAAVATGAGIGPILGGLIAGAWGWEGLFPVTHVTLLVLPALMTLLPRESVREGRFDLPGLILLSGFVAGGLFWLNGGSLNTIIPVLLSGSLFILWIRRTKDAFVPPALFRHGSYSLSLATTFLLLGTVFGLMFAVPILLKETYGLASSQIGWVMFPGAVVGALLGPVAGRLSDRLGGRRAVWAGTCLLLLGYVAMSRAFRDGPMPVLFVLIACYAGFAFVQAGLPHTISAGLPPASMGLGMGMYNLVLFLSGAYGAALLGRMLDGGTREGTSEPFVAGATPGELFLVLAAVVVLAAGIFRLTFRKNQG